MNEVLNFDRKRVCDVSADKRMVEIRKKNCLTRIQANPDGTLRIINERCKSSDLSTVATETKTI